MAKLKGTPQRQRRREDRDKLSEKWRSGRFGSLDSDATDEEIADMLGVESDEEDEDEYEKSVRIVKTDDGKRMVYGVALDPYQVDSHGSMFHPADVEQIAHEWLEKYRYLGDRHRKIAKGMSVTESYLFPYPSPEDYRNAMADEEHRIFKFTIGDNHIHSGSWVVASRVGDDGMWEKVKKDAYTAWSIGGLGIRIDAEDDADPLDKVKEVIEIKV